MTTKAICHFFLVWWFAHDVHPEDEELGPYMDLSCHYTIFSLVSAKEGYHSYRGDISSSYSSTSLTEKMQYLISGEPFWLPPFWKRIWFNFEFAQFFFFEKEIIHNFLLVGPWIGVLAQPGTLFMYSLKMLLRKLNLWQVRQQHSATVSVSSTQLQRKYILYIFYSFILYSKSINSNHNGRHLFFTLGQFEGEALEKLVNMVRIKIQIYKIRKTIYNQSYDKNSKKDYEKNLVHQELFTAPPSRRVLHVAII